MSQILVTGASGYLGTQLLAALLRAGQGPVRAQVRSAARADGLRAAVRRGEVSADGLEVVTADLTSDDGWKAALTGVDEVYHVASPIPAAQPADPDELVVPAREGTLRVLRAAVDAGVRRVVVTSSFAAIGYTPKPSAEFTEDDWTDPDMPGLAPYPRSKTIAERTAWDFIRSEGGHTELTVVNPTFILGPPLTAGTGSSMSLLKAMFSGAMSVVPRHRFGIVDVRDTADLHLRAMAAPAAAGRRFIGVSDTPPMSYLELAGLLRTRFGDLAAKVPTEEAPGAELPRLLIRNNRAKDELGWRPRPLEETVTDTVENLRERGDLPG
ncbi:MAG TPA: NAD-dependent epimerase/dehydratase family protein [Trebonia sp.]